MADILVLVAHPSLETSTVNHALLQAARSLGPQQVEVRDLYALYPDYLIDIAAEQALLARARLVVWQHPVHWYGMPPLMKLWLDEVLAFGWAYGPGGGALAGKDLWLVAVHRRRRGVVPARPLQPLFLRRLPAALRADRGAVRHALPAAAGAARRAPRQPGGGRRRMPRSTPPGCSAIRTGRRSPTWSRRRAATCRRRPGPATPSRLPPDRSSDETTWDRTPPGSATPWSTSPRRWSPCRWRGCSASARSSATWPPASSSGRGASASCASRSRCSSSPSSASC